MDGQWMTYAEVAERLGVSLEAVRQRAIRNTPSKREVAGR
jgi:DNA-directed RNA polymerase specialized sigma24 family protein